MSGLTFLQFQRTLVNPEGPPLRVYSTEETLAGVRRLCQATPVGLSVIDQDSAQTAQGRQVSRWRPTEEGQWI